MAEKHPPQHRSRQDPPKEVPFNVYLHPQVRSLLNDLTLDHGDKRAIINAAVWYFHRQPLSERTAMIRAFAHVNQGIPIETPEQKRDRLRRELQNLDLLLKKGPGRNG